MTTTPLSPAVARWLPYVVAATFFMEYLDTTIIATALPQMAHSFGISPNELSIGMTAYMLALAVFIPISGWVADRVGARTVFGGAIVVFTLSSVLCGISNGLLEFTAARVLQGIGGAMMVPVGRLIVVRNTEKSKLMQAIATITWPAIAAPVVGPPIGGFIVTYASWRWIFLLNVPFGIAALIAVIFMVRNERSASRRPLDLVGFFLTGAALTAVMYGTELASVPGSQIGIALTWVGAGIVLGFLAVRHARAITHPLIDYSTLKIPTYSVTVLTGSISRVGIGAVPYLMPLLFQIGFGLSAFHSGMLLLASAVGNLGMKAFINKLLRHFGFRMVSIAAVSLAGIFTLACGFLAPATPLVVIVAVVFVYGVARSTQFSTLAALAYADVPANLMSTASTLWSATAQMTIGMGIAFGALSLRIAEHLRGAATTADTASTADSGHLVLADFRWAFALAAAVTLISLIGYFRMSPAAGNNLHNGRAKA